MGRERGTDGLVWENKGERERGKGRKGEGEKRKERRRVIVGSENGEKRGRESEKGSDNK